MSITLNELRVVAPRVALYAAVAYSAIRLTGFMVEQAKRGVGMVSDLRK